MALNKWWRPYATERYRMEITDRGDLGADLHAPQRDEAGRDYWSYSLVTAQGPGKVVMGTWCRVRSNVAEFGPYFAGDLVESPAWDGQPSRYSQPSARHSKSAATSSCTVNPLITCSKAR